MSYLDKINSMAAAKAKRREGLPEAAYVAVITGISWPSEDDEPRDPKSGEGSKFFMGKLDYTVSALYGEHGLDEDEEAAIGFPRKASEGLYIPIEDFELSGTANLLSELIFEALELGDRDTDERTYPEFFEEILNQEVVVMITKSESKDKDGKAVTYSNLSGFASV